MLTAIYKYIFQPFSVFFIMILKNINTFVFTFPRLCVVSLIQIYHRTSSIPLMYKANMFTISLNSENDHSASFSHLLSIFK